MWGQGGGGLPPLRMFVQSLILIRIKLEFYLSTKKEENKDESLYQQTLSCFVAPLYFSIQMLQVSS